MAMTQWPGYKPWCKTIAALNWKKARAPITRVKLAEDIATAIRDLLQVGIISIVQHFLC